MHRTMPLAAVHRAAVTAYIEELALEHAAAVRLRDAMDNDRRCGFVLHVDAVARKVQPPPQVYKAQLGRRRAYLSQADADAYDRGWSGYPGDIPAGPSPASDGYFDRESRELDR